jgi:uncharacterized membrane protein YjgN (DUF898 family)
MATDGDADYAAYTDQQLREAAENIRPADYPLNARRLQEEQERRRAQAPPAASEPVKALTPEFRADGKEYFRIWIVNLALTIVTLGIYSAWAKVRKLRYFYSNASLAGSAFGYHADPIKILKGRVIAAIVAGAYFVATRYSILATLIVIGVIAVAMPWLVVRSRMFAMRVTSWRGIRFGFAKDYAGAYGALLGWPVLGAVTFGIMMPYAICKRYEFIVNRTRFGATPFACQPRPGRFYETVFAVLGMSFLIIIVAMLLAVGLTKTLGGAASSIGGSARVTQIVIFLAYIPLFALIHGYTESRNLNEVFGTTTLGDLRLKCQLRARSLMWIYLTNLLGIVFTLGLYTPWAQVRLMRYRLGAMAVEVPGTLDTFVAGAEGPAVGAAGEEIGEFLDVDFGF